MYIHILFLYLYCQHVSKKTKYHRNFCNCFTEAGKSWNMVIIDQLTWKMEGLLYTLFFEIEPLVINCILCFCIFPFCIVTPLGSLLTMILSYFPIPLLSNNWSLYWQHTHEGKICVIAQPTNGPRPRCWQRCTCQWKSRFHDSALNRRTWSTPGWSHGTLMTGQPTPIVPPADIRV